MSNPGRGARPALRRSLRSTTSTTHQCRPRGEPGAVARVAIAATARPKGEPPRRQPRDSTSAPRGSALTRYRSLTDNPVLRRPLESGLSAGVAVMDQLDVGAGVATRERHAQRVEHEIGAHVTRELPADHQPAV